MKVLIFLLLTLAAPFANAQGKVGIGNGASYTPDLVPGSPKPFMNTPFKLFERDQKNCTRTSCKSKKLSIPQVNEYLTLRENIPSQPNDQEEYLVLAVDSKKLPVMLHLKAEDLENPEIMQFGENGLIKIIKAEFKDINGEQ